MRASSRSSARKWTRRYASAPLICRYIPSLTVVSAPYPQIKVRDLSRAQVSIQPAEYASWSEARNELMVEAKRPLKAQLTAEVAAAADEMEASSIRAAFEKRERNLEHEIDHKPLEVHMSLSVAYNFLSK